MNIFAEIEARACAGNQGKLPRVEAPSSHMHPTPLLARLLLCFEERSRFQHVGNLPVISDDNCKSQAWPCSKANGTPLPVFWAHDLHPTGTVLGRTPKAIVSAFRVHSGETLAMKSTLRQHDFMGPNFDASSAVPPRLKYKRDTVSQFANRLQADPASPKICMSVAACSLLLCNYNSYSNNLLSMFHVPRHPDRSPRP